MSHDPELWREKVLCSSAERAALQHILDLGLSDTFRMFEQPPGVYSWWDYRMNAFRGKMGLRIDLLLASAPLAGRCARSYIDIEPRRQERPSDHAPAVAEFRYSTMRRLNAPPRPAHTKWFMLFAKPHEC